MYQLLNACQISATFAPTALVCLIPVRYSSEVELLLRIMKRCPECRRDYYDDTLSFCLDDGAELLEGPASADDLATAILSGPGAIGTGSLPSEAPTRTLDPSFDPAGSVQSPHEALERNRAIAVGIGMVLVAALGIGAYLYYNRGSSKKIESIAVMPFVNGSGNPDV